MKAVLVISARDNVATALRALAPGQRIDTGGTVVIVAEPIARGHKVALQPIASGGPVIKYGSAIGTASADIPAGAHVHTHNVASRRGRGDLGVPATGLEARLAEPPDDPPGRGSDIPGAPTTMSKESSS
ncbi:MAG TPA: UxaA family hydrolase [Vicinamibacterales bacterium]|nr:UxaA family hydrolase [Vicinamibacterales bacterium]